MGRVALTMLLGDRAKYLALVLGLSFAVLLMTQQVAIFMGLLTRATGFLQNIAEPDLIVADEGLRFVEDIRPMNEVDLLRVRSVPGVRWAQPLFSGRGLVERPDGSFDIAQVIGIDRSTLIGRPPRMVEGSLEDLRFSDAVILDDQSADTLGDIGIGDMLILNDRRAVVVGFARAEPGFESNVIVYTTYANALSFVPTGRDRLSFVMVDLQPGADLATVQQAIGELSDLAALTPAELRWRTVGYILTETGIGIGFGSTVVLGFIVGLIIVTATLYQFTLENQRYLAVFKAMGATRRILIRMMLLQAALVTAVGYGLGVGAAGVIVLFSRTPGSDLPTYFPWQLMLASLLATLVCVTAGTMLSLRKVLRLEPAIVFK